MRAISKADADKWLTDPENLSNRFAGNANLTREDALRIHAERFSTPPAGGPQSTPGPGVGGSCASVEETGTPSGDSEEEPVVEVLPAGASKLTDAERVELAVLSLQIGPAEAGRMMAVSTSTAERAKDGEGRKNNLLKDVVETTLEKARKTAAAKLDSALEGISVTGLEPVKATQVAVGLATVIEKIENRGKKDKGAVIVWRTAGRSSSEYEEVEIRPGA